MQSVKDTAANDMKPGVGRIKEDIRQTAREIHDELETAANRAGRTVRQYVGTATDEISHMADAAATQIRTRPVQSSLVALAVGVMLGAFLRR